MSRIIRYMFLTQTKRLKHNAHGAPLERRVAVDRHSIDMPPRWGGGFWPLWILEPYQPDGTLCATLPAVNGDPVFIPHQFSQ